MHRISIVHNICIDSVAEGSTFICGDVGGICARSRVLALQREVSIFFEDEGSFADYPVFSKEIPKPVNDEDIQLNIYNESPLIQVEGIKILGVSTASAFQVGSNYRMDLESRRKHIRHFVTNIPSSLKKMKQTIVL